MKRQQQENLQRLQEMKRKREEDEKRKVEEAHQQRQQEQQKRQEEMRKQHEEQRATLVIRRVIHKLRSVTPETLDALKQELEEIMGKELGNVGMLAGKVQGERDAALEASAHRVTTIQEASAKEEERILQLEKERAESIGKADALLKELENLVADAETAYGSLKEANTGLDADKDIPLDKVEGIFSGIEHASSNSKAKVTACLDHIKENGAGMKEPRPVPGVKHEPLEIAATFAALTKRLNDCRAGQEGIARDSNAKKTKATKKGTAKAKFDKMQAIFDKYDKDKDGALSRKEMLAYAKGEFAFTLSAEGVDIICGALVGAGEKGVKKAQLQDLKVSIGIARERVRDAELRTKREAREAELVKLKEQLQEKIKAASDVAQAAEDAMTEAEEFAKPLGAEAGKISAADMLEKLEKGDALAQAAKDSTAKARELCTKLGEGVEPELMGTVKKEASSLENRHSRLDMRVSALVAKFGKSREDAKKKEVAELETLKELALKMLRYHKCTKKLSSDELFAAIDNNSDGRIEESEFLKFFGSCERLPAEVKKEDAKEDKDGEVKDEDAKEEAKEEDGVQKFFSCRSVAHLEDNGKPAEKDLSKLFNYLDEDDEGFLSKAVFTRLSRHFMKVIKDAVITDQMGLKDGKTIRRLESHEVVEVLAGPENEGSVKVIRVQCKAMKDGLEGWVTIAGNEGSIFLAEGGNMFKVIKETILTDSLEVGEPKEGDEKPKTKPRKLKEGELLEVREWPSKHEGSGLTRMMCKAMSDSRIGWATTLGNTGIAFIDHV